MIKTSNNKTKKINSLWEKWTKSKMRYKQKNQESRWIDKGEIEENRKIKSW